MKGLQTTAFLLTLLYFGSQVQAQDQTATKGKFTIAAGVGFGIHGVNSNNPKDNDNGALTGSLRGAVDYGFSKRFALGLQLFRNGYSTNKDSNDAATNSGIGAYINYNFAIRPKTVWFFTGGVGYSGFDYTRNGKVTAKGAYGSLGLGFRRFFGDYVGIFMQAEGTTYSFGNFEYQDGTALKTYDGKDYHININGVELKTGILFRL